MPVMTRSQRSARATEVPSFAPLGLTRQQKQQPQKQQPHPLRRSARIARLNWLKRLRPRQQQEQVTPVRVKQLAPSKPAAALPAAEETFTMMANPMFFTTAPRSCTGWSCCCAAPHGFGPGRTNWCALYSDGLWTPEEPDPFVFPPTAAKTPPISELLSLLPPLPNSPVTPRAAPASPTPALSERTMNMVLAQVGVPVKPQSPNTDCMTQ